MDRYHSFKNKSNRYILLIILSLLFCVTLQNATASGKSDNWSYKASASWPVPDNLPIYDKNDSKVYFEEFEGRSLLIVFWASWCSACVDEINHLDILQKDLRKLPFKIITISEDHNGMGVVESFFQTQEIRHLEPYIDKKNTMFKAFDVVGIPTSFLVNADGMIIGSFAGNVPWNEEDVRNILLSNINGNHINVKNSYKQTSLNKKPK